MTELPQVTARGRQEGVLVSETFVSLQGEGMLTGMPSWFCRLSGCNLRCTWCDTPYASWDPEGTRRAIEELAAEAIESKVRHAVITGGEPMIFPKLAHLCDLLRGAGLHITIESAGTIDRDDVAFDLMSLSPKLANSTPWDDPRDPDGTWAFRHDSRRTDLTALQRLIERSSRGGARLQIKFVVTGPDDLAEIDELLGGLRGWEPGDIFLMPEGVTTPSPESVAWVIQECTARGWRYGHRLHIELFGDTRGT
ncbi:MAG: 7-carboxy-7-deazaguanine synthase QueE [Planctomycetota bacterium]